MVKFVLALLPIIFLILALSVRKMPGHKACPIALGIAVIESLVVWKQKYHEVFTGLLEGAVMALWPICLVIVAAIFVYNLVVHTRQMEIIKQMLVSVSRDKRVLVLTIAWGFGGFMEGMAGFGTAVAIPAGILVGLGFDPIFSATVCLVANTTPVVFGSIGIPTVTAAHIAGTNPNLTAVTAVLQMTPMILLVPFLLVGMTGSHSGGSLSSSFHHAGVISLASGLSFLIPQYLTAKYIGAELASILGSITCMGVTILFSKLILKDRISEFDIETCRKDEISVSLKQGLVAWSSFLLVLLFLILTSVLFPPIHDPLSAVKTSVPIYTGKGATPYTFQWITAPGVLIFLAGVLGGLIQKCPLNEIFSVLWKSLKQMLKTIVTIVAVVATAKVMGYSGMTQNIADFMVAVTGNYYPLFAPLIGSVGAFVTGSSTSNSILFSKLQASTATALHLDVTWLVSANIIGSTAGKIISPQSIAVATAATNLVGQESRILNKVVKYFILFTVIYGVIVFVGSKMIG